MEWKPNSYIVSSKVTRKFWVYFQKSHEHFVPAFKAHIKILDLTPKAHMRILSLPTCLGSP